MEKFRMIRIGAFLSLILIYSSLSSQTIFSEDFEPRAGYSGGTIPPGWTEEFEQDYESWFYQAGGHSYNPDTAADGSYNAIFQVESYENERTKLVTPPINLAVANTPRLSFWIVQDVWTWLGNENHDELRLYYKTSYLGNWKLLRTFNTGIKEWTAQEIYLDPADLSSTFYLAFEGKTGYGHGTCIDGIVLEETGSVLKQITEFSVEQASTEFIATNTDANPILKMPLRIQGNDGTLTLNAFSLQSLNTLDTDIKTGGVKLWTTSLPTFTNPEQIGTGKDFSGGALTFSSLNKEMPYGYSYLWITYDIKADALHGHNFDAKLDAGSITFSNGSFPELNESPSGRRTIFQTLYYQDFDTDYSDWTIGSGFEVGSPSGLGGNEGGSPDPDYAVSGSNVLGNGVVASTNTEALYANNLADTSLYAISPTFDLTYYVNTILRFDQWLNIEGWDDARIMYSTDGNETWKTLWSNAGSFLNENSWRSNQFDISALVDRKKEVSFRFSLGPTNNITRYSGWNIDNFVIVSNFIETDISITDWYGPLTGCGFGNSNLVRIELKNLAGKATDFDIPVGYSLDGGTTWVMETITQSIAIGDSLDYTFTTPLDLSTSGTYYPIVKAFVEDDEYPGNDSYDAPQLVSIPKHTIPYDIDFESGAQFWEASGTNSTWVIGKPSGQTIKTAHSGNNAWITSTINNFLYDDSSMVTSPCFDFSGIEDPVFEFANNLTFNEDIAGASLQYSLDTGKTWMLVPKLEDKWNWYTDAAIPVLQSKFGTGEGWATPSGGWNVAKHYLPKTLMDEGPVRFRIIFASESTGLPTDGFAFDDVHLYNSPPDIGVTSIDSPISACELTGTETVSVTIKNYGIDTLNAGTDIITAFNFKGKKYCEDTFTLVADVLPNETFTHNFTKTIDLSHAGTSLITAYTLQPFDIDFYDETVNNDTAEMTVSVFGMPDYDIGANFGAEDTASVILNAGAGFTNYAWNTGYSAQLYNIPKTGTYYVTVENALGCFANDSITVVYSAKDLSVPHLVSPVSACEITVPQTVSVYIKNEHNQTFASGEKLAFAYKLDDGAPVHDTLTLLSDLNTDDSVLFSFADKIILSDTGYYELEVYSILSVDINFTNDTAKSLIGHYGLPKIDFGTDTLYTLEPDTITLSVPGEYLTYEWQDASGLSTFTIMDSSSNKYFLTVTADHGCGSDKDSIYISSNDIAITAIANPTSGCELSAAESISFNIVNFGNDLLPAGTQIDLQYQADGGGWQSEAIVTTEDLFPMNNAILTTVQTVDFSAIASHQLELSISVQGDGFPANNTLSKTIQVFGYPVVNIGVDTLLVHKDSLPFFNVDNGSETASYSWNDIFFTNDAELQVENDQNWMYKVTVADNSCLSYDSIYVFTDDFSIDNTDPDIAFCQLGASEQLKTTIVNNSSNPYPVGTKLDVSYQINSDPKVTETHTLTALLPTNGSVDYSFSQLADLSQSSEYTITYSVNFSTDVFSKNNSLKAKAKAIGYPAPDFGFGDTIRTTRPDTIDLWLDREYDTYLWHDGGSYKDVFYVNTPNPNWYKVTVSLDPGCYGSDSVYVETYDLTITDIVSPQSNCSADNSKNVSIRLVNNFATEIPAGDSIFLSFDFLDSTYIDTLVVSENWASLDSKIFTFKDTLTIDSSDTYDLTCRLEYFRDAWLVNNEESTTFSIHGMPEMDLGPDTIFTLRPDTVLLNTGDGFVFYDWNSGQTSQAFFAPFNYSYTYSVTAGTVNICYASDSITIITTDIAPVELISPADSCELSISSTIAFSLRNNSADTIFAGSPFKMVLESPDSIYTEELLFASNILPGLKDTISVASSIDLSMYDTVDLKLSLVYFLDVDTSNNSISRQVKSLGNPIVNLNADTLFLALTDEAKVYTLEEFDQYAWSTTETSDTITLNGTNSGWTYITATNSIGCKGTDSVAVMSRDISVSFAANPSACQMSDNEVISIYLKNLSAGTISPSDSIFITLSVNETATIIDTALVTIPATDSVLYSFAQPFDFSAITSSTFSVKISLENDVVAQNNIAKMTVENYGYPQPDLGQDSIFTTTPDTVILQLSDVYDSYMWNTTATTASVSISDSLTGWYIVTVADIHGCAESDSVFILTRDIALTQFTAPVTSCMWSDAEEIKVTIKNTGADSIIAGSSIKIDLLESDTLVVSETHLLLSTLHAGESVPHTFSYTFDTKTVKSLTLKANIYPVLDVTSANNSTQATVKEQAEPPVSFVEKVIITNQPDTVKFDFPSMYTYKWSNGSNSNALSVPDTSRIRYTLTISDEMGCTSVDSVAIVGFVPDIDTAISLKGACMLSSSENISFDFINTGNHSLSASDSINIYFEIDGASDIVTLPQPSLGNDTLRVSALSPYDLSATGSYPVSYYVGVTINGANYMIDSAKYTIDNYGFPQTSIAEDTVEQILPITISVATGYTYLWSNGNTGATATIKKSGWTWVTISNQYGCKVIDSVLAYGFDIVLDSIIFPLGNEVCRTDLSHYPQIMVTNNGSDTLKQGDNINVTINGYSTNVTLPKDVAPQDEIILEPGNILDRTIGDYSVAVSVLIANDINPSNNATNLSYSVLANPSFKLYDGYYGPVQAGKAPYTTNPGPDGFDYLWSTGETTKTIKIYQEDWYSLTIIDDNQCTWKDSAYIVVTPTSVYQQIFELEILPTEFDNFIIIKRNTPLVGKAILLNGNGVEVFTSDIYGYESLIDLESISLPSGIYLCIYQDAINVVQKKLIKR